MLSAYTQQRGTPMRSYRTRAMLAPMLMVALLSAGCTQPPGQPKPKPANGNGCTDTCSSQPDTITIKVVFHPLGASTQDGKTAEGEATWSKAGQHVTTTKHVLNATYQLVQFWEHDWAKQGYPRITVTADTNIVGQGGVACYIDYLPAGSQVPIVIDFEQRGPGAMAGSVHCDSDVWFQVHNGQLPGGTQ